MIRQQKVVKRKDQHLQQQQQQQQDEKKIVKSFNIYIKPTHMSTNEKIFFFTTAFTKLFFGCRSIFSN